MKASMSYKHTEKFTENAIKQGDVEQTTSEKEDQKVKINSKIKIQK